ncbi:putative transcription factor aatf che-1 protein [Coleophoma crateriformis]|uniref:Protein BFR2 n=1 Tax=Coleophoma crateriformis TaxID=565419 RepID=A0A3D8SHF7_9HELO|nr:putative transcription factor aatf che-1 protein [Coleophoma crateriformis]
MGKTKTLAQQIAELEETAPKDFDPEADSPTRGSDEDSDSGESHDGLAGTEHYVDVGKSKLRKRDEVALGPQYTGARVSRQALLDEDSEGPEFDEDEDSANEADPAAPTYADPEASDIDIDDDDADIDSDAALGDSDEEKFKEFTFRGSGKPKTANAKSTRPTAADFMSDSDEEKAAVNEDEASEGDATDEDILDVDEQHSASGSEEVADLEDSDDEDVSANSQSEDDQDEEDDEDEEDEDDNEEEEDESDTGNGDDADAQRAELRRIMNEEQKSVVATISQAAKADADKGNAVKQQRKAFDSLLNVRIRLQKALVATNSMSTVEEKDTFDVNGKPYQGAQEAAIQLWNSLDALRYELSKANNPESAGKKRKHIEASTSSSKIWKRMKTSEVTSIDGRQSTLEKWSSKVKGTTALPLTKKLNQTVSQQTITTVLQEQLASSEHLVKRTKMPRSCAPIQAKQKVTEDPNIFDDADFYQMLLKELVDQRMADSSATTGGDPGRPMQWTAVKEAKTRKNLDTKASKGRKMKFTVHEKLQNFMAPQDRGSWEQDAIDRFFSTLLGQKVNLGEDEAESENDDAPLEEESLMLFRS